MLCFFRITLICVHTLFESFNSSIPSFLGTDLPWLKRMMVEIPHVPLGVAVMVTSIGLTYVYLNNFYEAGIGFQERYTGMRKDAIQLS